MYEREGKAVTNFTKVLPDVGSNLAREITKDKDRPYMDLFQGQRTTNYKYCKDQLQIDHVLFENSERIYNKYKCTSVCVDKNIPYSDHYPLKWAIEEK